MTLTNLMKSPTVFDIGFVDSAGSLPFKAFIDALLTEGKKYIAVTNWGTDVDSIQNKEKMEKFSKGRCLLLHKEDRSARLLAELPGGFGYVKASSERHISAFTAFDSETEAEKKHEAFLQEVRKEWPVTNPQEEEIISIGFWSIAPQGYGTKQNRKLGIQLWEDIQENYPDAGLLDGLMREFVPAHGGKTLLWHGIPGTGKTTALRSLAYSWRDWCDIEYIVDPEAFFGSASYMMSVVMTQQETPYLVEGSTEKERKPHPWAKNGKWRLLILEDAGELLAEDARQRNGQALSRFLNLADGMIGQGMKILSLVTTNEPLGKLHPAVARPGRCAAEVEFKPFTGEQAEAWMQLHDVLSDKITSKQTLAELYAKLEGFKVAKGSTASKTGF